jgi:hypothetical protein
MPGKLSWRYVAIPNIASAFSIHLELCVMIPCPEDSPVASLNGPPVLDATETIATRDSILRHAPMVAAIAISLFIALYAGDYLMLRYRIAAHGVEAASSSVPTYSAAPLKNGRLDVYYDQPQMQTCVRSIFPWLGYPPCWYLRRHTINLS